LLKSNSEAHRPVAFWINPIAAAFRDGFQIRARAKRSVVAVQHANEGRIIGLEFAESNGQSLRGRAVNGVADLRPAQYDGYNRAALFNTDCHNAP